MLPTVSDAIAAQAETGASAAALARTSMGRYLTRAAWSGAAVGAVVVLLVTVSARLVVAASSATLPVQGSVFGMAFALVLLGGAELATGIATTTTAGVLRRGMDLADAVLVWLAALIGNLLGAMALALVVDAAGVLTSGGPAGQPTTAHQALGAMTLGMGDLGGGQLFLRAVLCNLLLAAAIWTATRAATQGAKLLVLGVASLGIVAAGLELSVANMSLLSLAALSDVGTWGDLTRNLTFTVPGNLVGGVAAALLVTGIRRSPSIAPLAPLAEEPVATPTPVVPTPPEAVPATPAATEATPATKVAAKKVAAKKVPAEKTAGTKAAAKTTVGTKAAAKKTVGTKAAAKKTTTTAAAKKAPPRRRAR